VYAKGVCVVSSICVRVRVLIFGWVFPSQDFFIYMAPIGFLDSIAQLFKFLFNSLSNVAPRRFFHWTNS
jgi:hypothetical protein